MVGSKRRRKCNFGEVVLCFLFFFFFQTKQKIKNVTFFLTHCTIFNNFEALSMLLVYEHLKFVFSTAIICVLAHTNNDNTIHRISIEFNPKAIAEV